MPTSSDYISKTAGICGGEACIRGHRIPVWLLVGYRQLGWDDAKLLCGLSILDCGRPSRRLGVRREPFGGDRAGPA
jgi:hypothetical protein